MQTLSPEQLAFEIEDVIRTMPSSLDFAANPDNCVAWLGRASAAMNAWDMPRSMTHFEPHIRILLQAGNYDFSGVRRTLLGQLHQAQSDLRLKTTGPLSLGIGIGRVFDYFDEVRKIIESAKIDLFFVDPYLDAEFVARYLPHAPDGTRIRLLAREKLSTLKPSIASFIAQTGHSVEVRSAIGFHDRYVLVDGQTCYQSGASFKDGAKKTPTTLTQITDAFSVVQTTYEDLWAMGAPV